MNYFENNMSTLKQNRRELHDKISKYFSGHTESSSIIIESLKALNNEMYILVQKDNNLHRLNSSYSPKNEAEKWVQQFSFNNMNIVISLFGLGSGLFARELMNHKSSNDTLIIYEPSIDVFIHVLNNYDIRDILENSSVFLTIEGINEFEFHHILRAKVNITNLTTQIQIAHPGYEEIFIEQAIYFWKEVKDNYVFAKTNINTEQFFGKRYIINDIFNSRYLKDSSRLVDIKEYINTDIPAIVVAAGPSVKESIVELRKAKGKAYIFAVDRILDYLLDSDIEPDFVVTVDPKKPLKYFTNRTNVTIPLLCGLDSNWEVLEHHKGKKIIYNCSPYFQKMFLSLKKEPPILNTGASVATTTFSICVQLGFKSIVLVGQDMAYDGEYSHAGGVAENRPQDRDIYVEGIGGGKVRSRDDWYNFLNWYQDMVILYPDIDIIDTKSKGAKIRGAIQMPLKDVLVKYGKENAIDSNLLINSRNTFSESEMGDIREYFSNSYEELRNLKRKAEEAIKISEEQIRVYKNNIGDNQITEKNYKKISKINKYIYDKPIYHLLETFITAEAAQHISEMYRFSDDEQQDKIATYKKSIEIFKAIIDGAEFARTEFEKNIESI